MIRIILCLSCLCFLCEAKLKTYKSKNYSGQLNCQGEFFLEEDGEIKFRSRDKIYFLSHMSYIRKQLEKFGVTTQGELKKTMPVDLKAEFAVSMKGFQLTWLDEVNLLPESRTFLGQGLLDKRQSSHSLQSLSDQSFLLGEDFEVEFEIQSKWNQKASLLLYDEKGQVSIQISLDHTDQGLLGFPVICGELLAPFQLQHQEEGLDRKKRIMIHNRSKFQTSPSLSHVCAIQDYINHLHDDYWNRLRVRSLNGGQTIEVTLNGLKIYDFSESTLKGSNRERFQMTFKSEAPDMYIRQLSIQGS